MYQGFPLKCVLILSGQLYTPIVYMSVKLRSYIKIGQNFFH